MENKILKIIVSALIVGWIGLCVIFLVFSPPSSKPTLKLVQECPAVNPPAQVTEVTQDNVVKMPTGWTCNTPAEWDPSGASGTDTILQPTGVWEIANVLCQKNTLPISKYCAENPSADCTDDQKAGKLDPID